ncbi:hypothetical protein GDO86_000146 [Hymenochirus boettgeri]|uniref:DNA polymerase nu pseudo-exo domain-containing protein n=1 Tax=Hymenochirus boettgeri TaxID=247094 RepID=A0A8T2K7C2_9PIPI|nr:hypothetical protein GDO86_000146 [Hymenochirus boettgeri]
MKDAGHIHHVEFLGNEEQLELLEEIKHARALVITIVFQDGSSQLNAKKESTSSVKGIIILIKKPTEPVSDTSNMNDLCNDKYIFIASADDTLWKKTEYFGW